MRYRRWWAMLLLIGFVAALAGLPVFTGGRLYGAGIVPRSLTVALRAGHQPDATADHQHDQAQDDGVADRQGRARTHRWRERGREATLLLVNIPSENVVAAIHPAPLLAWWSADDPRPRSLPSARHQPGQPRGP